MKSPLAKSSLLKIGFLAYASLLLNQSSWAANTQATVNNGATGFNVWRQLFDHSRAYVYHGRSVRGRLCLFPFSLYRQQQHALFYGVAE